MKVRALKDTPDDLTRALATARRFTGETAWGWTFDAERAEATLRAFIADPAAEALAVESGGSFVAGALVHWRRDFTAERVGYLVKFYVLPEARGTGAARALTDACADWFDRQGVTASFAACAGALDARQTRLYHNLMARAGYTWCGPMLAREGEA